MNVEVTELVITTPVASLIMPRDYAPMHGEWVFLIGRMKDKYNGTLSYYTCCSYLITTSQAALYCTARLDMHKDHRMRLNISGKEAIQQGTQL
jgi:hypothetical protein